MLNMIKMRFTGYKRSWFILVIMTLLTLVQIYAFGVGFSQESKSKVYVVDNDNTIESGRLIEALEEAGEFDIVVDTYDEAINSLEKNSSIAVIVIDEGYTSRAYAGQPELSMIITSSLMEHVTLEMSLEMIVSDTIGTTAYINTIQSLMETSGQLINADDYYADIQDRVSERPMMVVSSETYNENGVQAYYDSLKQSFMGFILFFSLFTIVFGIGELVEEKENRVWHRQQVSPTSNSAILGSSLIVGFIFGTIQIGSMVIGAKYLFDIDLGDSLVTLIVVLSVYIFTGMSMGLFISAFVKTNQQLSAITPMIIVSTSMLGGCMWPLEMVTSKIVVALSYLTPQRYAMEGLQKVILYNGNIVDVLPQLMFMLLISLIFFSISLIRYKKFV